MGRTVFGIEAFASAVRVDDDSRAMIWAFVLVAALSAVAFTAVWFITTTLAAAPL